jgi:hypothetical protein
MRNFLKKQDGSAALDFALVAVPLVAITMGIIEFAIVMFINTSLESGVIQASRYAITGSTTPGVTREERVVEIINEHGFGLVNIDPSQVQTLVYPNFDSVGKPEPFTDTNANGAYDGGEDFVDVNGNGTWDDDMGAAGLGGAGDIVTYSVEYDWGFMTNLLNSFTGDITLISGVAVRNEPY